jgi:hypothetical protein
MKRMPAWFSIAPGFLRGLSSATSFYHFFRKKKWPSESPFVVVPLEGLSGKLSSPLRVVPGKIDRGFQSQVRPGVHLFLGTAGVGKTREAADFVENLSRISGAKTVLLAKGYVGPTAPLPARSDVRRIIVFIDDYDLGFPPAMAASFEDRQAGYAEAIANIGKLYRRIKSSVDLHALIITVNTYRLPVMCEECGIRLLWPQLESIQKKFIQDNLQKLKN